MMTEEQLRDVELAVALTGDKLLRECLATVYETMKFQEKWARFEQETAEFEAKRKADEERISRLSRELDLRVGETCDENGELLF